MPPLPLPTYSSSPPSPPSPTLMQQIVMRTPTALDRLTNSKNAFFAFAGIIVGVSAWVIWHDEPIFGSTNDPYGFGSVNDPYGDAGEWTTSELRGYLQARGLDVDETAAREELVERVKAYMRAPTPRTPLLPRPTENV